jgi:uncharacterized membrane protein YfcA
MAGGISLVGIMATVMVPAQVVPIHGVVQLASNFTRTLVFLKHVSWRIFFAYAPTVLLGVWIATLVWSGDKLTHFKPLIGVFLLVFLVWRRTKPKLRNVPLWWYAPVGLAAGFIGIFVGAMGPFIAPFFLRDDFAKEEVIATKAVCQAWGHVLKIPAFVALGFPYAQHLPLIGLLLICVVLGTFSGKWVLNHLSKERFITIYEGVLGAIGLFLIAQPFI